MLNKYKIGGNIGKGATSDVYKVQNKNNNKYYAYKSMMKRNPDKDAERRNEIDIHSKLHHPNIIDIIEHDEDNKKFNVILELCGNNLFEYMKGITPGLRFSRFSIPEPKHIDEREALDILYQIAKAVKYLHDNGIAHRDIKLENIVNCGEVWKLVDFGFATGDPTSSEIVGTLDYVAPEIVRNEVYDTKKIDVWTLGVLLYELLYNKTPFYGGTYRETYKAIANKTPDFSKRDISPEVKNLIETMLNKNPNERIDINTLLSMLDTIINPNKTTEPETTEPKIAETKNLTVYVDNIPSFIVPLMKTSNVGDIKRYIAKLYPNHSIRLLLNKDTELGVFNTVQYDNMDISSVWDQIDNGTIYLTK